MQQPSDTKDENLIRLWNSKAPIKTIAFAWRVFLERIPTKDNLAHRGIALPNDSLHCDLCLVEMDSVRHTLFSCIKSYEIWQRCCNWLGINYVAPQDPKMHFTSFLGCCNLKGMQKFWSVIWLTILWVIWNKRNKRIFQQTQVDVLEVVDLIKIKSWLWVKEACEFPGMPFTAWDNNPFLSIICYTKR